GDIGLAHAYWRAAGLTAERVVADPYGPPRARMYRTRDPCRYPPPGVLGHLGRVDPRIKNPGVRVEARGDRGVLTAHPDGANCAVVADGTPTRLFAFVVAADGGLDPAALAEYAAKLLPTHMRPETIVAVPQIPVNVNGKIDSGPLLAEWRRRT